MARRHRWSVAVLVAAVACSSQASAPGWKSFSSADYGYSISYPPGWYDLGGFGAPAGEHYLSNRKGLGSPVEMQAYDMLVEISPDCQSGISHDATLISRSNMVVDGIPTTRYLVSASTSEGPYFSAVATIEKHPYCYRISMLARSQHAVDTNLADFDRMLKSIRFSSRSAPAGTPVPTVPPATAQARLTQLAVSVGRQGG
jgi:hypothetical protein